MRTFFLIYLLNPIENADLELRSNCFWLKLTTTEPNKNNKYEIQTFQKFSNSHSYITVDDSPHCDIVPTYIYTHFGVTVYIQLWYTLPSKRLRPLHDFHTKWRFLGVRKKYFYFMSSVFHLKNLFNVWPRKLGHAKSMILSSRGGG